MNEKNMMIEGNHLVLRQGWQWKARIPRGFTHVKGYLTIHSRIGRGLGTNSLCAAQIKEIII